MNDKTKKSSELFIVFKVYDYCITTYNNYYSRISNARAIMHLPKTLKTQQEILDYCEEYLNIQDFNIIFK